MKELNHGDVSLLQQIDDNNVSDDFCLGYDISSNYFPSHFKNIYTVLKYSAFQWFDYDIQLHVILRLLVLWRLYYL